MTLDDRTTGALARLSGNTDFTIFMNYVRTKIDEASASLLKVDTLTQLGRMQGKVTALRDLLDEVEAAPATAMRRKA